MILTRLVVLFFSLGFLGCQTSSVVETKESTTGCAGLLPVSALSNKAIDIQLANLIVQQVSIGNFKVEYTETMEALLSDKVLDRWVKEEMACQGAKTFETPEQKIWFLTMKEVSEKSSAQEFILWLKDNPINKFTDTNQKLEGEAKIERVSGKIVLPRNLKLATIRVIFGGGELHVPGPTMVIIESCDGLVKYNKNAQIIIQSSFSDCIQEEFEK